jgi:hypothetical protein
MEKAKNDRHTATAEGAVTAAAETAHSECYLSRGCCMVTSAEVVFDPVSA